MLWWVVGIIIFIGIIIGSIFVYLNIQEEWEIPLFDHIWMTLLIIFFWWIMFPWMAIKRYIENKKRR